MLPVRKRMRLSCWYYSNVGCYFLTLCSKERKPIFSRIVGRGILDAPEVQLTSYGKCIYDALSYLAQNNEAIELHNWVIMPNHVHILLSITKVQGRLDGASGMSRPTEAIIPRFVSSIKRFTNKQSRVDLWQTGYYDHIIRDEKDFLCRWQYIDNNPSAWLDDDYYVNENGASGMPRPTKL